MNKHKRVYHPYHLWEEIPANMWGEAVDKEKVLEMAIDFTGNHLLYGYYMVRVIKEWPISCENALTDYTINRKAWVGHAACALALGIPENITREAWGKLDERQRLLANEQAVRAIRAWEDDTERAMEYVRVWEARCYSDGIPDVVPTLLEGRVPSYKAIALAILKNDLGLTALGFAAPKSEWYEVLRNEARKTQKMQMDLFL